VRNRQGGELTSFGQARKGAKELLFILGYWKTTPPAVLRKEEGSQRKGAAAHSIRLGAGQKERPRTTTLGEKAIPSQKAQLVPRPVLNISQKQTAMAGAQNSSRANLPRKPKRVNG